MWCGKKEKKQERWQESRRKNVVIWIEAANDASVYNYVKIKIFNVIKRLYLFTERENLNIIKIHECYKFVIALSIKFFKSKLTPLPQLFLKII